MKCESFSGKLFGMQKLTGLRGKTAKTIKKRFFKKNLTTGGSYNNLPESGFRLSAQCDTFELRSK